MSARCQPLRFRRRREQRCSLEPELAQERRDTVDRHMDRAGSLEGARDTVGSLEGALARRLPGRADSPEEDKADRVDTRAVVWRPGRSQVAGPVLAPEPRPGSS